MRILPPGNSLLLPEHPITQKRQVHLVCSSRTVCVATSSVTITSPECEGLFLDQKFAIGQLFRHLRCPPKFTLIDAETNVVGTRRELRRNYRLEIEGIVCDILEEFPDRDMFVRGQAWLDEPVAEIAAHLSPPSGTSSDLFQFTPFPPVSNPTLVSILEKQAADPIVGQQVFALYPDPFDQTSPSPNHYVEITYRHFNDLVDAEAALWSERFIPVIKTSKSHPVIAVLGDSGFNLAVTVLALSKLHATIFLLAPAVCDFLSVDSPAHLILFTEFSRCCETSPGLLRCFRSFVWSKPYEIGHRSSSRLRCCGSPFNDCPPFWFFRLLPLPCLPTYSA